MILPSYLWDVKVEIEAHAKDSGLDFFETIFEILSYDQINEVAAYGGFPTRYPHWRYGMDYQRLSKGYTYGLQTIYEMVINNDPCYAYLLEANHLVDQKTVIAHVYAHCDFFKNNYYFSKTNRKMIDEMANHAARIRGYVERYGLDEVEHFLDICLSIDNLIDPFSAFITRESSSPDKKIPAEQLPQEEVKREYMRGYLKPDKTAEEKEPEGDETRERKFPEKPVRDILLFLQEHAPIKPWERDIISMVREEAYYFAPQAQTKIMNEGWAVYWHSKIMTEKVLSSAEIVDYADRHSGIVQMSPHRLNPYKLGWELFKYIEERWDKGKFGKEWEDCDQLQTRNNWNMRTGLGREKLFQIRSLYNDVMFIDEFMTREFIEEAQLFNFDYNKRNEQWEISNRDFQAIKGRLLSSLTNIGNPFIFVEDSNYENRGELLLIHKYEDIGLDIPKARDTLENLNRLWKRPVNIITIMDDKKTILSFDGKEHTSKAHD